MPSAELHRNNCQGFCLSLRENTTAEGAEAAEIAEKERVSAFSRCRFLGALCGLVLLCGQLIPTN